MPITKENGEQYRLKYISQTILSSRTDREKIITMLALLNAKVIGDDKIAKVTNTKNRLAANLVNLDKKISDKITLWNKVYLGLFKKTPSSIAERDALISEFANKKF
jgi:hypothetical protein